MIDLNGARIMVTGGTGSFGNALIDYLHDSGAEFIVYSRDETKQHEMYITRQDRRISYVIGDVRDKDKLIQVMRQGIDFVVHAAALKQVPTGEKWPEEVLQTNVIGTKNAIEAAEYCGVGKLVFLSTDKATYPIGSYGMSKALAERFVLAHVGNTINTCLRYGNVLGSRGSIIPLFLEFIRQGKPLTITNPNMTRFILTLEEAVKIALKCLSDGEDGELFIMRPPACTVETIVQALELHSQKELERRIIGIRPGEKIHEVLLTGGEVYRARNEMEDGITYSRISAQRDMDYYFSGEDYVEPEPFSSDKAEQYGAEQVLRKLKEAKLV